MDKLYSENVTVNIPLSEFKAMEKRIEELEKGKVVFDYHAYSYVHSSYIGENEFRKMLVDSLNEAGRVLRRKNQMIGKLQNEIRKKFQNIRIRYIGGSADILKNNIKELVSDLEAIKESEKEIFTDYDHTAYISSQGEPFTEETAPNLVGYELETVINGVATYKKTKKKKY